jgi:rhodanese-like protein
MLKPMRILLTTAVAVAVAAAANAQYKPMTPQPTQQPGAVQVAPNNNIQVLTSQTTAAEDELASAKRIPRDEAVKMVKEGKAVWIDVRSKDAYDQAHIPGAISIPLNELNNRLKELPPHKYLITYCA